MATGPQSETADPGPDPAAAPVLDYEAPPPRRRTWIVRTVVGVVVLAVLAIVGRRFYDELYRLREAPPLLVALIFLLWPASRYPAAVVMRTSLRALGTQLGRYEAFMLQMVQSYSNVLVPRSGIGVLGLYMKRRRCWWR